MSERADIHDQARNKWASILSMFGVKAEYLTGAHSPCPLCGGRDRFRFDNKDGRGTWFCNGCGAGNGMDLLLKVTRLGFAEAARQIRERLGEAVATSPPKQIDPERAKQANRELWKSSMPIGDDEAGCYLAARGFRGPYPPVLRFCPSAAVKDHPSKARLAAMLGLVTAPGGQAVNIHRTYLEDGWKARMDAPRKMMAGTLPAGSAIRLCPYDGKLGVAEGIETALAVTRDFGIPCWATLNSAMLAKFLAPDDVSELHIFGDNDPKFGGQAAAYDLAHRTAVRRTAPPIIEVHIPPIVGTDWADTAPQEKAA